MSQRKVISQPPADQLEPWLPPAVENAAGKSVVSARRRPVTASQLESVHKQAYEDGFARGREEGFARGLADGAAQGEARLVTLLKSLARPLEDLDERVEEALVSLAMSVARHLVRRELKSEPGQIVAVVREAVSALPLNSQVVHLYLHPEDATLVRETLSVHDGATPWHIVEDPVLTRGGCRVVTETSQIDASVEQRVAAVIAKVLGEERDGELGYRSGQN